MSIKNVIIAAAAALVCTATAGAALAAPSATETHRRPPRVAVEWVKGWNSHDPSVLATLFTKDATYTDLGVMKTSHGRDGVVTWRQQTDALIDGVHAQLTNAFRSGDQVTIETVYSGHIKGAPTPFAVPLATVLRLRHGKIESDTDYYNLAVLLAQSGLPPNWTPPTS